MKTKVGVFSLLLLYKQVTYKIATAMKKLLFILFLFTISTSIAQDKYLTKTGTVNFEASVPSFEEVAASNSTVTAILNSENGEFAALALVKGFRFKNALMEEHFNENYAESSKYPKATFKGIISGFDLNNIKSTYNISGELEFHGVKKSYENLTVKVSKNGTTIILAGSFKTNPIDFNIEIPSIVKNKIAENVDVSFRFELEKK